MALVTAQDFIIRVLRHCVQLRPGYVPGPELLADCLNEWAALYDTWNLDRNMPLTKPEYTYSITSSGFNHNNRDYQIGPSGADFVGPRPVRILKANLIFSSTNPPSRVPIDILPWEDYGAISVLQVPPTGITTALYYEPAFPNGIIHCWPPINANSIEIWQNGALVAPASLSTTVTMAPGYQDATVFSLAEKCQYLCTKEMGPRNPKLAAWALKARQHVRNANAGNPLSHGDFRGCSGGGGFSNSGNITLIGEP